MNSFLTRGQAGTQVTSPLVKAGSPDVIKQRHISMLSSPAAGQLIVVTLVVLPRLYRCCCRRCLLWSMEWPA
eukprot:scaffold9046_cov60-Attheya_sp.AAC.4